MALVVNNNIPALQTYNAVNATTNSLQKSIQKLSSGLRINSAADDAAGLAISEKMRAQVRGLDRAISNSQDGISMLQTAEGALSETHSILQRMRELSVQAANDTLTQQDRSYIQLEIDQLREEVTRIGNTTQFNKKKLLDGSAAVLWSSDSLSTKAIINGGLRTIDEFGQKSAAEGNFVIDINADPGKAQVQKTDVFTIKHADVIMDVSVNQEAGVKGVSVNNIPAGDYTVALDAAIGTTAGSGEVLADSGAGTNALVTQLLGSSAGNFMHDLSNTGVEGERLKLKVVDFEGSDPTSGVTNSTWVDFEISDAADASKKKTVRLSTTTSTGTGALWDKLTLDSGVKLTNAVVTDQLRVGMELEVEVAGAAPQFTVTTDGAASAANLAAAGLGGTLTTAGGVVVTDKNGNILNEFSFDVVTSMSSAGSTLVGDEYHIQNFTGKNLDGTTFNYTVKFSATGAGGSFTTSDGITVQFTGLAAWDGASEATDVVSVVAKPKGGGWTVNTAAATALDSLTITATPDSTHPDLIGEAAATAAPTLTVRFDGVASDQLHVTFDPDGSAGSASAYGEQIVTVAASATDASVTIGGYTFDLTGITNDARTDVAVTYNLLKGADGAAKLVPFKTADAATDYVTGAQLEAALSFSSTDAAKDDEITLVVKSTDTVNGSVTFDATASNGTKLGDIVFSKNASLALSDVAKTYLGSSASGSVASTFDFNAQAISVGDEVKLEVKAGKRAGGNGTQLVGRYGTNAEISLDGTAADKNASILLEVESTNSNIGSVTFKATANLLAKDGTVSTRSATLTLSKDARVISDLGVSLVAGLGTAAVADFKAGDKLAYNVNAFGADTLLNISGEQNEDWDGAWGESVTLNGSGSSSPELKFGIDASKVNGQEVHFRNFFINETNGTVYSGDIVLSLDKNFSSKIAGTSKGAMLASFEAAYVGQVAKSDVKLRDLNKFWNSEGRFLLDDAQSLTITQGDGTKTSVTLYATDALQDVATKLNEAIAQKLGQNRLLTTNEKNDPAANSFVTFVNDGAAQEGTSEAAPGTFVVRSIVSGVGGEINFAGDEDVIKAFSLNEIQTSAENTFTVSVWDAHNGKSVASGVKITGNKLIGTVNENVDVVFDPMANIQVEWNDATKSFNLLKEANSYQTILHLADNTTVFQIGANEGEDMGVNIGDMRAEALNLNSVLVTDRESAARSVTIIDNAIDKVSMQRAKIGAYQNRLEHSITNLTIAGENLTAAESRIRDTDMAKEMMNFTKLQIMLQAGTSMLAQANALPQNVLSLIR